MNLGKKLIVIALVLSVGMFTLPGLAKGATAEELQAQINDLLAQIQALQSQLAAAQGTTSTTSTISGIPAGFTFTTNLKMGMTGDDVKYLQIVLNSDPDTQVATTGAGSPGNETSYFGPLTKAAVVKFQEKYASDILAPWGLTKGTGFVGSTTRTKLNSLLSAGTATTPAAQPSDFTTEETCTAAGYYWYNDVCNAEAQPAEAPMTVKLAEDTPPSANVQKGSALNPVAKFTFVGGDTPVSITGLTLKSYGTTEATGTTDVAGVTLFDENNVQIGTTRTPTGNQVNFVIVPALVIPANGTKTITVAATIGPAATTMAVVRYGIESATAITSTGTFSADYPVIGNSFTIVPAGQLGSLSVTKYSSLPKTTVKVGEKDVVIGQYTISAGSNEDLSLAMVTVTNSGTVVGSDLANIRLRETDGTVIAGPATLSSNNKINFILTTPITLTKGTSVNLQVIADIAAGGTNGRNIVTSIGAGGVVAKGLTSGTNITNGVATANNDTVTIGNGTLTVTMSSEHPQGVNSYFVKTTNRTTIAAFDVRANGESIILDTIQVKFHDATDSFSASNYLSNVGLYDGDALVSNLNTVIADNTDYTFSLNWTVPANTTKVLRVKAATNNVTASAGDSITTTWSGYNGYGLSSGANLTSTTDVSASAITLYGSGKIIPTASTTLTPYSQGIVAPVNNVVIGALKVYAQRENMKLTDLVISVTGTNYDDKADISSLTLYADDGTTQLSLPVAYDTTGADDNIDTFTFDASDFSPFGDIVFTKGEYKTILIKANVASSIDGTTAFYAYVADSANQMKAIGLESGTTYDASTDMSGDLTFKISSPYAGGEFSFDTTVVEIAKAADSPAGSVSRGTFVPYAKWDVVNADSTLADATITSITFTSKTGLPSGLDDTADEVLFKLVDGDGNVVKAGNASTDALVKASGTMQFNGLSFTVKAGEPKQLILEISTTNTAKWPSATQMQWTIAAVGDVTVTNGVVGYGGDYWTIPADTNVVTLP